MPQPQPKKQVFNEKELMTDEAAEAEELAPPSETPIEEAPPSEVPEPAELQPVAEPQTKADKRWNQLLEERKQLQQQTTEYERQLREQNERWARLDERRKQLDEARQSAQQQQTNQNPYDPAIDPVGAKLWDLEKRNEELLAWKQQQEQNFGQLQQTYLADRQNQDFNNWVVAEAQNYQRQQPDYADAAQHAAQWRMNWWMELGMPQDQARQMVIHESNLLAQISRQSGKPFAPVIYKLAQSVGYQPRNGNATRPVPAQVSAAGRTLAQAAKGQAMQGLGRVPSAGANATSRYRDMSATDIAQLSEAEWSRAMADPQTRAELEFAMKKADGVLDYEDASYAGRR